MIHTGSQSRSRALRKRSFSCASSLSNRNRNRVVSAFTNRLLRSSLIPGFRLGVGTLYMEELTFGKMPVVTQNG